MQFHPVCIHSTIFQAYAQSTALTFHTNLICRILRERRFYLRRSIHFRTKAEESIIFAPSKTKNPVSLHKYLDTLAEIIHNNCKE